MKLQLKHFALVGALSFISVIPVLSDNNADNSGQNVADRNESAKTPESQSNANEDVAITRNIRKAIVKDSALSVYAHNIKIITTKEHVVYLRGAISSSDDLDKINALAQANSGGYPVKNQISVTTK